MLGFSKCALPILLTSLFVVRSIETEVRGAEPTRDAIQKQYVAHGEQLNQLSVHWRSSREIFNPGGQTGVGTSAECRAVVNNEKRLFDIQFTLGPDTQVPEFHLHRAMSYDGNETSMFWYTEDSIAWAAKQGRIYSGDGTANFEAPDHFLALQGLPKSRFVTNLENPQGTSQAHAYYRGPEGIGFSCDLATLLQNRAFGIQGTVDVDGVACVQASTPVDQMFFDPARGYALIRRDLKRSAGGPVRLRYSCKDFKLVKPGLWLARTIIAEAFNGERLESRWRLEVVELELGDVPDSLFAITIPPGTPISDARHFPPDPKSGYPVFVRYESPIDPKNTDVLIEYAIKERLQQQAASNASQGGAFWMIFGIGNVVLLFVVFVGIIIWRVRSA